MSQLCLAALVGVVLIMPLGGCSTPDAAKTAPPKVATVDPKPRPPRAIPAKPRPRQDVTGESHEQVAQQQAQQKVASIDPNDLVGLDPPSVEKMLGTPSSIFRGDPSITWTYEGAGCAFKVIFYPDIKTANFRALKFLVSDTTGESSDDSQTCIRNILTVRNNGPA